MTEIVPTSLIWIVVNIQCVFSDINVDQVDSCTESAEAACDILSQLVNCTIKTLGLISTARPSFMDVQQVSCLLEKLLLCILLHFSATLLICKYIYSSGKN